MSETQVLCLSSPVFKMAKKTFFLIFGMYFLAVLQSSFFINFGVFGKVFNLVFLAAVIINLIEKPERRFGVAVAFMGGFFLDIFSYSPSLFFGFYTSIFLLTFFLLKLILGKYVQIPAIQKI